MKALHLFPQLFTQKSPCKRVGKRAHKRARSAFPESSVPSHNFNAIHILKSILSKFLYLGFFLVKSLMYVNEENCEMCFKAIVNSCEVFNILKFLLQLLIMLKHTSCHTTFSILIGQKRLISFLRFVQCCKLSVIGDTREEVF